MLNLLPINAILTLASLSNRNLFRTPMSCFISKLLPKTIYFDAFYFLNETLLFQINSSLRISKYLFPLGVLTTI
jgi:hypothetical protein